MSCTELYVAQANGDVVLDSEFRNSWGGGAFVWTALCQRYAVAIKGLVPKEKRLDACTWPGHPQEYQINEDWKALWRLPEEDLRPWERDVLLSTFDWTLIAPPDLERLAKSMRRFEDAHARPNQVCSLLQQAGRIEELAQSGVRGIGWNQTSVNGDAWQGPWNESDQESEIYNIDRHEKHVVERLADA